MSKLSIDAVTLCFDGGDRPVLTDINLEIEAGESIALIGPSGCGKSSLLRVISGLLTPTEGRVCVDGEPVTAPRRKTALVLQDFGLLPWKNVFANAELGLKVRHVPKSERSARAKEALSKVELTGFERAYPDELSGGMKQRLAIARALALDVDLMLMDEPLSALDALLREKMQDLMCSLWREQGYTQLLVTHSIEEAAFLGQRIVIMSARPGHIMRVVENPEAGSCGWRTRPAFHELCDELRALLRQEVQMLPKEAAHA